MSVGHHHYSPHTQQPNHGHHGGNSQANNLRDASSYEVWKNFLSSAGIPDTVAHDYALTFSKHRVKIDMLKDITKDILFDMGIKAMGDIIAILRHAKDLCTQDELKSACGSTKTTINTTPARPNLVLTQPPTTRSSNTLAQRMPIVSRSGSSISTTVGNKIQSRLNLNSGALIASSTNSTNNDSNHSFLSQQTNKRLSSTISSSLSKRLKPGPDDPTRLKPRELTEKTLTVHYPSSSAIARAQQRISGTVTQIAPHTTTNTNSSLSIRSRLGSTVVTPKTKSESTNRLNLNDKSTSNGDQRGVSKRSGNSNSNLTNNRITSDRRSDSRDRSKRDDESDRRHQPTRPKSTVFSRLGETHR